MENVKGKNVLITKPITILDASIKASDYIKDVKSNLENIEKCLDTIFDCLRDGEKQEK